MKGSSTPAHRFPPDTSRYTLAMAKCLEQMAEDDVSDQERAVIAALVNLVQGRMLEYLADRICREFRIEDPPAQVRMVTVLMGIFSDEFFALFRSKIEKNPELVVEIARRITRKEGAAGKTNNGSPMQMPSDRLFPAIFRKYFEYRHLDMLLDLIESDAEIQRIILACLLERCPADAIRCEELLSLADSDPEGVTSNLFMGYVRDENVDTLLEKVRSGDWKAELRTLKERMAHLRGE